MSDFKLPRQRVRVPMPVLTPMTKPESGTVTEPWLYYLMNSRDKLFENPGWVLATCDPLTTGEDKSIHQPIVFPGKLSFVSFVCKTPSTDGRAVLDIQKSSDGGTTWNSVFLADATDDNKIVMAQDDGYPGIQWATFDPDYDDLATGDKLRIDCLEAGTGAQWITVKFYYELSFDSKIGTEGIAVDFYAPPLAAIT